VSWLFSFGFGIASAGEEVAVTVTVTTAVLVTVTVDKGLQTDAEGDTMTGATCVERFGLVTGLEDKEGLMASKVVDDFVGFVDAGGGGV
jgi:hypothetical protein